MKKRAAVLLTLLFVLLLPLSALAETYIVVKGGGYFPTGKLKDLGYDIGPNGNFAIGHYIAFSRPRPSTYSRRRPISSGEIMETLTGS